MADPVTLAVLSGIAAFSGYAIYQKAKTSSPPSVPPAPPLPLAPGVYPANTPGAVALELIVANSDGNGVLCATPGGCQAGDGTTTVWYGPGTQVDLQARVQGFAIFTAFDHFEGPVVSTRQNPFVATVQETGFVKAVYAFLGRT